MALLILLRHGESQWNRLNLFTGWVDVPLSPKGIQEALDAGERLKNIPIDLIYTSTLDRAMTTLSLAMSKHDSKKVPVIHHSEGRLKEWGQIYSDKTKNETIPVIRSWHLNERMYGELQGLNKAETAEKFGDEQVHIWRRSYDVPPPNGESLEMTAARTIPYFEERIVPKLEKNLNLLISAHGNSLRSIMMKLDQLSPDQVVGLEIPTGVPIFYEYKEGKFIKHEPDKIVDQFK